MHRLGGDEESMLRAMNETEEAVILVHGLWMNAGVLVLQQRQLRDYGFAVHRFSYPSWRDGLAENVRVLAQFIADTPGRAIHVVAHSLGGLVALGLLSDNPDVRVRRVVLMATPCAGSHCGSVVLGTPTLARLVGQTYKDWCRLPRSEIRAAIEIGVIAGTLGFGLGRLIPGLTKPNDGLITVEETRLAAAKDHVEIRVCHSGMLVSRACAHQAAIFLKTGQFTHD
jgi:pimeloyl-ACP methyl ester carboxylesterase